MLSKRSKICGIFALALAVLGLAIYLFDSAIAAPKPPRTGNDSNSGLISSRLGM